MCLRDLKGGNWCLDLNLFLRSRFLVIFGFQQPPLKTDGNGLLDRKLVVNLGPVQLFVITLQPYEILGQSLLRTLYALLLSGPDLDFLLFSILSYLL